MSLLIERVLSRSTRVSSLVRPSRSHLTVRNYCEVPSNATKNEKEETQKIDAFDEEIEKLMALPDDEQGFDSTPEGQEKLLIYRRWKEETQKSKSVEFLSLIDPERIETDKARLRVTLNEGVEENEIGYSDLVGILPFPYDESDPLRIYKEKADNGTLTTEEARKHIRLLRKKGKPDEAIEALCYIKDQSYLLDNKFFNSLVKGLTKEFPSHAFESFQILKGLRDAPPRFQEWYEKEVKGMNALDTLNRLEKVSVARSYLELDRRLFPGLFRQLIKSGETEKAVQLFNDYKFRQHESEFNVTDFHHVISHHLREGELDKALSVHHQMDLSGVLMSAPMAYDLMSACYRAGRPQSALNIYDLCYLGHHRSLPHCDSPASLNLALHICNEYSLYKEGFNVFDRSLTKKTERGVLLALNIFSKHSDLAPLCKTLANYCRETPESLNEDETFAFEFQTSLGNDCFPVIEFDDNVYRVLIKASSDVAEVQKNWTTLCGERNHSGIPNALYNEYLTRLYEFGEHDAARKLLEEFKHDGETFDVRLVDSLRIAKENNRPEAVVELWKEMKEAGITPVRSMYERLIPFVISGVITPDEVHSIFGASSGSGSLKIPGSLESLVGAMGESGYSLDAASYTTILKGLVDAGDTSGALELFNGLDEGFWSTGSCNLALHCLSVHGNVSEAETLHAAMIQKRVDNKYSDYLLDTAKNPERKNDYNESSRASKVTTSLWIKARKARHAMEELQVVHAEKEREKRKKVLNDTTHSSGDGDVQGNRPIKINEFDQLMLGQQ